MIRQPVKQPKPSLSLRVSTVALVLFFTFILLTMVGLPNLGQAGGFLSALPTAQSGQAMNETIVWIAFALIDLYAVLSALGLAHRKWTTYRREYLAQAVLGSVGFGLFCLGIVHTGAGIQPGAAHEALNLVRSIR